MLIEADYDTTAGKKTRLTKRVRLSQQLGIACPSIHQLTHFEIVDGMYAGALTLSFDAHVPGRG